MVDAGSEVRSVDSCRRAGILLASTRWLLATLTAATIVAAFALTSRPLDRGAFFVGGVDFRAFYCGGAVVIARQDPYVVEPLRSCERTTTPKLTQPWAVLPAPYPGYALAFFSLFSHAAYPIARALWLGSLTGTLVICAMLLSKLTSWPVPTVCLSLLPTALMGNLIYGSAPPFAMLGLLLAALAVSKRRESFAPPALALALIDPHIALPSAIAFGLRTPRAWVSIFVSAVFLAIVSLLAVGLHGNLEYFYETLPLHARSEIFDNYQYSLTHVLAILKVAPNIALALGSLSFVLLTVGSIVFARREARAGDGPLRALLVPAGIVCLGGTFMHFQEITLAIPAAFVLARGARSRADRILSFAVFAGILYSPIADFTKVGLYPYVIACAAIAWSIWPSKRIVAACLGAAIAIAIVVSVRAVPYDTTPVVLTNAGRAPVIKADDPGSLVWRAYLEVSNGALRDDAHLIAMKIPTWLGLIGLIVLAIRTRTIIPLEIPHSGY